MCSTDDPEIATVARVWGADVLDRPAILATATATSADVALHALDAMEGAAPDITFRAVVLLQPTSPFTDPADVVAAVGRFDGSGGRSVASVSATHPAGWHVSRPAGGSDPDGPIRRVDVEDAEEVLTGAIYVVAPQSSGRRAVSSGPTPSACGWRPNAASTSTHRPTWRSRRRSRRGGLSPPPRLRQLAWAASLPTPARFRPTRARVPPSRARARSLVPPSRTRRGRSRC